MPWIFLLSYKIISHLLKPVASAILFSSQLADYLASFIETEENPSVIKPTYLGASVHIYSAFSLITVLSI